MPTFEKDELRVLAQVASDIRGKRLLDILEQKRDKYVGRLIMARGMREIRWLQGRAQELNEILTHAESARETLRQIAGATEESQ